MVGGFMELVALQMAEQPAEIQPRWKAYIVDGYNSSAVLREHISDCIAWYADDFLRLLPVDPLEISASKTSDRPDALNFASVKADVHSQLFPGLCQSEAEHST